MNTTNTKNDKKQRQKHTNTIHPTKAHTIK